MDRLRHPNGRFITDFERERFVVSKWNSGNTKTAIAAMLCTSESRIRQTLIQAEVSGRYKYILTQREWSAYYRF